MHEFFLFGFHYAWGHFLLLEFLFFVFPYPNHYFSYSPFPLFLLVVTFSSAGVTLQKDSRPWERGDQENELQSAKIPLHSVKEAIKEQSTY